jgi:hypothetical protein
MELLQRLKPAAASKRASGVSGGGAAGGAPAVPGVQVRLGGAQGLPRGSDAFVVLRLGQLSRAESTVVANSAEPVWDQTLFLAAPENTAVPLEIHVLDSDLVTSELLGEAAGLDISELPADGSARPLTVALLKKGKPRGTLSLTLSRAHQPLSEVKHGKKAVAAWAVPSAERRVVVEVIRGMDLLAMDVKGKSDPYLILKLNDTKRHTRVCRATLNPLWQQRFDFALREGAGTLLSVECWDKEFLGKQSIGRIEVDLSELQPNMVNDAWYPLRGEGAHALEDVGAVHLLISVIDSGLDITLTKEQRRAVVGSVKCHVVSARGLRAADFGGSSDPFCELHLGNARLRTKTAHKSLEPVWDQVLEMPVRDIFSALEVSVFDNDSAHSGKQDKHEFLGKVLVPLLEVRNNELVWFALKTEDCLGKSQGELQLAFRLSYKVPKAYQVAAQRREPDYMAKPVPFSLRRLANAFNRFHAVNVPVLDMLVAARDLLNWTGSPWRSLAAAGAWALLCLLFRAWHAPLLLAILLLLRRSRWGKERHRELRVDRNGLLVTTLDEGGKRQHLHLDLDDDDLDDDEEEGEPEDAPPPEEEHLLKKKQSRKSIIGQLRVMRSLGKRLQDGVEAIADFEERVKNLTLWAVPLLTLLLLSGCVLATLVLFFLPLNVVLLLVGEWQFAKRYLRKFVWPRSKFHVPITEVVEFVGRAPSDLDKVRLARLPLPHGRSSASRGKTSAKL